MKEKLKRCPFCGAEVIIHVFIDENNKRLGYWINHRDTNKCGATLDMSRYGEKYVGGWKERKAIVRAWNTRCG